MVEEEKIIEDENLLQEAEYSTKSDFSKAGVVQSAVMKVQETRSKEMKSGYFNIVYLQNGSISKQYIPDTRKEYIGSVEYLLNVLSHEAKSDDRAMKALEEYDKKKKIIFDKYGIPKQIVTAKGIIMLEEKYIPEVDEVFNEVINVRTGYSTTSKKSMVSNPGMFNANVKHYWDEMVELSDFLFSELNILIAHKNYFKSKMGY